MLLQGLVLEPGLRLYALGDVQAEAVQRHPRLIPDCPEEREASSIRVSIPLVWVWVWVVGRVSAQSLVG